LGSAAKVAMNFAAVGSSRNFGSGSSRSGKSPAKIGTRQVPGVDRDPGRGVGVAPLDDPLEERAQRPQAVADADRRQLLARLDSGPGRQPKLVALDVAALNGSHRSTGRIGVTDVAGEQPQDPFRSGHGRRPGRDG
jgi:hypothetical protein